MSRFTFTHNFAPVVAQIGDDMQKAATATADEVATGLKLDLRSRMVSAGLGTRLGNTWRSRRYPVGRLSLNAAAYVWSNAPDIIDAFDRGATIRPVNGKRYLAIPTENVPPRRRGSGGKGLRMNPEQVELEFNQDLKFAKAANGRLIAFVNVVGAKSQRGFRRASAARISSGRQVAAVVMFIMVPTVHMPKKFDIDSIAELWAARVPGILSDNLAAL